MSSSKALGLALSILLPMTANSALIDFEVSNLGGNTYQYNYTINNDLGFDIEEFSIYFDVGAYENLTVTNSPVDWDSFVAQPDPFLPDDGFLDSLYLSTPLADGDTLSGFSVSFDWLGGAGGPGSQWFEVLDSFTWDVLADGVTELSAATSVPEPSGVALLLSGLLGLSVVRRQRFKA